MNIKKALIDYIQADATLSAAFPRVYPMFSPVSSSQLNISVLKSIYPNITVVETAPERGYSENGLNRGIIKTQVQIDLTTLVNLNNFTHPQKTKRDAEFQKINDYDETVEAFIFKILTDYSIPAQMSDVGIQSMILIAESSVEEEIDSALAKNHTFYRKTIVLQIIYNPVTG